MTAAHVLSGGLAGFLVGLTGVGGGALMAPMLIFLFGIAPGTAVATDLWFAALTKSAALAVHQRSGSVDWPVVRRLALGSLPAALLVTAAQALGHPLLDGHALSRGVGILVLVTGLGLLLAPFWMAVVQHSAGDKKPVWVILAGALLGICVAATSLGAGALGSLALIWLFPARMTPHRLVATDIAHALLLGLAAGLGYLLAGKVDGPLLAQLLLGSLPGVLAGSLLARRLSTGTLRFAVACVLVAVGTGTL